MVVASEVVSQLARADFPKNLPGGSPMADAMIPVYGCCSLVLHKYKPPTAGSATVAITKAILTNSKICIPQHRNTATSQHRDTYARMGWGKISEFVELIENLLLSLVFSILLSKFNLFPKYFLKFLFQ
jgi:hypothetical protein